MPTTQTNMTAEDLFWLPEDHQSHELVRGQLTTTPFADSMHGVVALKMGSALYTHVKAKGLGEALAARTGFILARNPDTVRAPDVAFISTTRIPAGGLPDGYVPFAPNIAAEVASISDKYMDVIDKIEDWLSAGTALVWVLNPRKKTVTVHRTGRDPRVLREKDTLEGEEVCPGFAVKVSALFPR